MPYAAPRDARIALRPAKRLQFYFKSVELIGIEYFSPIYRTVTDWASRDTNCNLVPGGIAVRPYMMLIVTGCVVVTNCGGVAETGAADTGVFTSGATEGTGVAELAAVGAGATGVVTGCEAGAIPGSIASILMIG